MRPKLIAICLLAAALTTSLPAGGNALTATEASTFERAILKLPAARDLSTPAVPAHLPAPAATTGIGPGSHLLILFDSEPGFIYACTANFIWSNGSIRYLGAAGHCFVPPDKTATHGPGADYSAAGTHVRVCVSSCLFGGETGFYIQGTTVPLGAVAYSRSTQNGADLGNDFGIVTIPSGLHSQIRTSIPVWGGPGSVGGSSQTGTLLCFYGNGIGVGETFPTMARAGIGISTGSPDRWSADLPSMQGDSGSAIETCAPDAGGLHGVAAVGVLTHLTVGTGIIGGTTMSRAKAMALQAGLTINALTGA